jgi:hypothetical protein
MRGDRVTILCEKEIADTVREILVSRNSIGPLDEMKADMIASKPKKRSK